MQDLYNKVVEIIGVVPLELDWLYSLGTIVMLIAIVLVIISPFLIVYYLARR